MKKILTAIALATAALSASATTLVVEYDWNAIKGKPAGYSHNQYYYVGLIEQTSIGTFDVGAQTTRAFVAGNTVDNARGYEVGYSYPLSYDKLTITPRIAYGRLGNIEGGLGTMLNAKYYMPSIELSYSLAPKVGVFTSFSHMNGINADSVVRANRVMVGVDYAFTKEFALRSALSTNKFGDLRQNGVVLIGAYTF